MTDSRAHGAVVAVLEIVGCGAALAIVPLTAAAAPEEMVIGETLLPPGIEFIFEGAIKDDVTPTRLHLDEDATDVHLEARVTWSTDPEVEIPPGNVRGGFVPYLHITARVVNERTGMRTFVDLVPHINLVDGFHYARNMNLPGLVTDTYTVTFEIVGPWPDDLALHYDWRERYGNGLTEPASVTFGELDFEAIARARRR